MKGTTAKQLWIDCYKSVKQIATKSKRNDAFYEYLKPAFALRLIEKEGVRRGYLEIIDYKYQITS